MQKNQLLIFSVLLLSLAMVAGCGGKNGVPANAQVSSISVTCGTCIFPNGATGVQLAPSNQVVMDITEGQVEALTVTILGSSGQALTGPQYPLTYTTDDPSAICISPGGQVCGGIWDAQYVNCNPGTTPWVSTNDVKYPGPIPSPTPTPTPGPGATPTPSPTPFPAPKLTIATTGGGGGSVTITVKVHPVVDTVKITTLNSTYPATQNCVSQNQTTQFSGHAFSNGNDVTFDVGYFVWAMSDARVGQV